MITTRVHQFASPTHASTVTADDDLSAGLMFINDDALTMAGATLNNPNTLITLRRSITTYPPLSAFYLRNCVLRLATTHFLNNHSSSVNTIETRMLVISGKWKLKFSRWIDRSPGRRPNGSLESHGQSRPAMSSVMPRMIRNRCIGRV